MILTTLALSFTAPNPQAQPNADRQQRSFRIVYSAGVAELPAGAKQLRLWLPVPVDTPDQKISNVTVTATCDGSPVEGIVAEPGKDGSKGAVKWVTHDIQNGIGRSLCLETSGKPIQVDLSFDVQRFETHGGGNATPEELARFKEPNRMIPLDGKVAAVAAGMKVSPDPTQAARALYDHTLDRMKYDKPENDKSWGRGDAEWACDAKFGNCTDFHSYFMGLARSKGLPARFEMGFSVPGGTEKEAKIGGYHCWAYVWIEGHGWMPVDISEADKNPTKADYFFGTLDADRVTMTGGRDLVLDPAPAEGPLNFFVYPYAEIDGKKLDGVTKAFKRVNL